jgi:hypothetical protein
MTSSTHTDKIIRVIDFSLFHAHLALEAVKKEKLVQTYTDKTDQNRIGT